MTFNKAYATIVFVNTKKQKMSSIYTNLLTLIISITTIIGLSVHGTHADKILTKSTPSSSVMASDGNSFFSKIILAEHHIHVEGNSFSNLRAQQPSIQPKNENEKKYIAAKRLKNNSFGNEYIWPSI